MFFIENYLDSVANMIKNLYLRKPLSSSPNIISRLVNVSILQGSSVYPEQKADLSSAVNSHIITSRAFESLLKELRI